MHLEDGTLFGLFPLCDGWRARSGSSSGDDDLPADYDGLLLPAFRCTAPLSSASHILLP